MTVFFLEVCEFKRLETTLGSPHGKQHDGFASNGAINDVKHHVYLDSFIQRLFQVEQTASKGELVQSRADLPAAVQPEQSQNGPSEFDPGGAPGLVSSS